jgi:hypothetical protein
VHREHANSLGNEEIRFADLFFALRSALLANRFGLLSEMISFRKTNMAPTNKHEEGGKCEIPT